jgi:hypothetical protein
MSTPDSRRRTLAALGMILAPAVMLANDLYRLAGGEENVFAWSLFLQLSMTLFLLAILGMVAELRPVADRTGLVGGLLAGFGATIGAVMQGFFRTADAAMGAVDEAGAEAILAAVTGRDFLFSTRVPGITFPIGFLVLAGALVVTRRVPVLLGALVAVGAALFPVGRIAGLEWAVMASGVAFTLGLGWMAVRTVRGGEAAGGQERPARAARGSLAA